MTVISFCCSPTRNLWGADFWLLELCLAAVEFVRSAFGNRSILWVGIRTWHWQSSAAWGITGLCWDDKTSERNTNSSDENVEAACPLLQTSPSPKVQKHRRASRKTSDPTSNSSWRFHTQIECISRLLMPDPFTISKWIVAGIRLEYQSMELSCLSRCRVWKKVRRYW
jgi:hypothetical protein